MDGGSTRTKEIAKRALEPVSEEILKRKVGNSNEQLILLSRLTQEIFDGIVIGWKKRGTTVRQTHRKLFIEEFAISRIRRFKSLAINF